MLVSIFFNSGNLLIRFAKQALQAQQNALDVVDGAPLVLENVKAYAAGEVNVGMIDGGSEDHGRRGIGIVVWEGEAELEGQAGVGGVCRTDNGGSPVEQVPVVWESADARRRRHHEGHEFGL